MSKRMPQVVAIGAVALLGLAACSDPGPPPVANDEAAPAIANLAEARAAEATAGQADTARPVLAIGGGGLRLVAAGSGSSRAIPFGQPQAAVIAMLERLRGPAERGESPECGAGPMQFAAWKDGLHLAFQDGKFTGWWIDKRGPTSLSTMDGLFVGATRADVMAGGTEAKIFESTLGTEFARGDIGGLLDGPGSAANVTDLWAGTNCMFR